MPPRPEPAGAPRLLLTRTDAQNRRTAAAARRAGFRTATAPLLAIRPLPFRLPAGGADGLFFTSAEAPALAAGVPALRGLPAWAVGPHTAAAVRAAGFALAGAGGSDGSAAAAMAHAAGHRHLLHPGGRARAGLLLPQGVRVTPVPVYEAVLADQLPPAALRWLAAGDILATLLFSPRTAAQFARLADAAGLERARLMLVALSPAVAAAAGPGWRRVATAAAPSLQEALAAAERLWQGAGDG